MIQNEVYEIIIPISVFSKHSCRTFVFMICDRRKPFQKGGGKDRLACQIVKKNVLFNTLDVPWYPFPYIRFRQFPIRNLLSTLSAFPLKGIPVSLNWETLIVISLNTPRRAHRPFPSISEWEMAWAVFWVFFLEL